MSVYFLAIGLTIVSNLLYHISTKKTDGTVNAFLSLAVTYAVACGVSLLLVPVLGLEGGWRSHLERVNWASLLLGVCIVFLEFGFILAYRVGWNISLAALYSNVAVALVLLPIGILCFRETLSVSQMAGLTLSLIGLVLLSR